MSRKQPNDRLHRRALFKLASAGAGAAALPAILPDQALAAPAWNEEADVVIAGYGGAGACAAIEAHDAGAKVLILEKQPQATHYPNTRIAAGAVFSADPAGDKAAMATYAEAIMSGDNLPWMLEGQEPDIAKDIAAAWAKYEPENIQFLQKLDPDFKPVAMGPEGVEDFPGFAAAKDRLFFASYTGKVDFGRSTKDLPKNQKMMGEALFACMNNGVTTRKNIRLAYETPVQSLVTDASGQVTGVVAQQKGKPIRIKARRGVVITTGGYEFNAHLRAAFLDGPTRDGYAFYGTDANRGEGIVMALRAGASLLKAGELSGGLIAAVPTRANGLRMGVSINAIGAPNSIVVNNLGKRYFDESEAASATYFYYHEGAKFDIKTRSYPEIPSWLVFDETLRKRGPMAVGSFGSVGYGWVPWTPDNMDAINRGWILKADSIDELASKIQGEHDNRKQMTADALKAAVQRFNDSCAKGTDDLGRKLQASAAIATPPYYALALYIGGPNTSGGLYANADREVLDWDGKPIPRLFAAGEIASLFKYVGSAHLSECIVCGRIAGKNAAALKAWG